jgi:hypothetical protein
VPLSSGSSSPRRRATWGAKGIGIFVVAGEVSNPRGGGGGGRVFILVQS